MSNDLVVFYIRVFIDSNKVTKGHDTSNAVSYHFQEVKEAYRYVDNKGNMMMMASDQNAHIFSENPDLFSDQVVLPLDYKDNITMVNAQKSEDEKIHQYVFMLWADKDNFDIARNQVENFVVYQKSSLHSQILKSLDLGEMLDYSSKRREAWAEEKEILGIMQ